ncbi:hypothetical protein M3221_15130 [Domibacillus indicus]|uniref:hypothetical protein n=1 Tax=Domibacillus indicus TaxID=1437523 RepID=UPI00203A412D|nr:hypothetical protein [Domibacillus indicus]MCM3789726.1 hypothetical protein [Domibacillus indicus]
MNVHSEKPVYYNGYGLDKLAPINKKAYKEFVVKPNHIRDEGSISSFPYFPYMKKLTVDKGSPNTIS